MWSLLGIVTLLINLATNDASRISVGRRNKHTQGTFTASFRGYKTTDISTHATADTVKTALENLPSINLVDVESTSTGWSISFQSEAGDLPLIETTSGRLLNDNAKVVATEVVKGDAATLIYDGSETPGRRTLEALDLTSDSGYAFKVAPINAIGDGILSSASIVTVARAGASASKTTATGSALSRGVAGSIQEEQIVTFLSNDCSTDKLILSFELVSDAQTENLCGATEDEFEIALNELLGSNNDSVHVSREDVSSSLGHSGYSWSVTFTSRLGDVPMLTVDKFQVGNGHDASGKQGLDGNYVVEFLKGQSNEFTIEPKKASGSVVRDIATYAGMEGGDAFFTELWTSDVSIVDGSHTWYSDGGVASYNTLLYIEQMIGISKSITLPFHLSMDTSEALPWGRIDGMYSQTSDINEISTVTLQDALAELPNVGKVQVTQTNQEHDASMNYFIVTFRDVFGEYPLLSASDPSIMISRNDGQFSATEVQTITLSVDKPFIYEVQSIAVSNDDASFDLSFKDGPSTSLISCNFASINEAQEAVSSIESELNALPNVKVSIDTAVGGSGLENVPWTYRVTFLDPVGPLPLLNSNKATITQLVQGESTLGGSIVLSYEGEYTDDIAFDASAKDVKDKLEMLSTIDEVNVRKIDKYTGYQWAVSFTGNAGNLPLMVAHDNIYEVQSIETSGGQPTPLGGSFTLSYLSEETGPLSFDSSADMIKSSLESLPSIDHVDVSQEMFEHGQAQWLVTFRLPSTPVQLVVNKSNNMSGTLDDFTISTLVSSVSPSLVAQSGSAPMIVVEEQVAGLPSYTGQYRAEAAGEYSLAVLQLDGGGLNAKYYDNQWMLEDPVIERVDPTINFHWGSDIITQYGRDYVSVRWWGKVRPQTSEPYTFYLHADDGARLYIDHELILDLWEEHSIERKATVDLTADAFHDIKVEYKEITGDAHIQLEWSSRSLRKQIIPSSQLFHPSHIVGSPFTTTISPGAADYPHSDFIDDMLLPGQNRSVAIAGDKTSFYLQAKDSSGNDKITNADAQGDLQEEQFEVDIVGDHGLVTGDVTYIEDGQYRVDYNVLKAGTYQVHVKTGGTDIYCGLGEDNKCSPFTLTVLPGATLASTCEVEASFDPVDDMVEAKAGEIGNLYLQAKDAFGNNRISGGDDVLVLFKSTSNPDIQYRGNAVDRDDGTYSISYSIPLAGSYQVSITIGGEPVKLCVGPSGDRWDTRQYNGISVYSSPSFCSLEMDVNLNVIHRELHGITSTLVEDQHEGLSSAVVGVETGFTIEARDKFGNLRSGTSTSNIDESGDGESDAFLVSLVGPSGHTTLTSTAVQVLTSSDSITFGYFRLSLGGQVSEDLPHDISGPAMQVLLSSLHADDNVIDSTSVQVSRSNIDGNYQWKVTFVDHLELWSQHPLSVLPGSDGFDSVSDTMSVTKQPSAGIYPVHYTLWEKGIHELSIVSGTTLVSDSSHTVDVTNGLVDATSSSAFGNGLEVGIAGEESSFEVHVRDVRQSEVQSIKTHATSIDIINEVQQLQVLSNAGETFQLTFRGQQTGTIEVDLSTLDDVTNELEALSSIGQVSVSSVDGSFVIQNGDTIDVEFETELGSLSLLTSSGSEVITKLVDGETPHRAERQSISCNADGGYIILSFKDSTTTIDHDDDISTVTSKLSNLFGNNVTIVEPDDSITTICSSLEKTVFIVFPITLGDVEPPNVSFNALENGVMSIFGNGEEHYGAVDGISPIMGYFTLSLDGDESSLISVTASEEEMKTTLENLPSIGSVSVTKDVFGIRQDQDGQNIISGETSLFSIYTITFADRFEDDCEPGHWDNCPANIGDVSPLVVDSSMVTYDIGTTQQQSAPTIEVFEVVKGSTGNMLDDADDQVLVDVSLSHNIEEDVTIDSFDIAYLGGGIYNITYTPTISGHYSASIKVNNEYISTDLSDDVIISPASASAQHCTHDINLVAIAGSEESFHVVARDRFGNLVNTLSTDTSLEVLLEGSSDDCQSVQRHEEPSTTIEELEMSSPEGHYKISYTPSLSGEYQSSIMLQSRGGLLATYYKNQDFSQPVYDESTNWCEVGEACDSTRLDKDISFDWGFESSLPSDPSFPMESFSIVWEGELKVDASDDYIFTTHLNGGVRITIGDEIILDSLEDTSYFSVSSTPLPLDKDTFYDIKVEYVHKEEEAKMQLLWESSTITKEIVPSDVFYYTRHISESPSSITVAPGDIAITSNASGEGLVSCTALEECSFIIQTQDVNQNNRYTDGSDPGFEITIQGSDGWAAEGRVNSVASSPPAPIELSDITITSNDWQYIGEADVVHLSNHVTTKTNMVGTLLRGDSLVIERTMYTVSATGTFDSSSLPLQMPYLGPTKSDVSVFKAASKCTTGTHMVTYTPNVRGEYSIDVKLPSVIEVQRVTTSIRSEDSLGGAFSLTYQDEQGIELESGTIAFDADETSVQMAIEDIESIDSVSISLHECDNPTVSCSWDITFLSLEGDVNMLKPNTIQLVGDLSDIQVEEVVKGRSSKSITGFPRAIDVSPGETNPSWTIAYGRGLVSATAGEKTSFAIQPKDVYGNDRLAEQEADLFEVYIYPEQGNEDGSIPIMKGTVHRESEGYYTVEYTPTTSGHHTIAVVQAVSLEKQVITTGYNTVARGGSFIIKLGNLSTPPLPWDVDETALKHALDTSMSTLSTFNVKKLDYGLFNFKYDITYETLMGDVPSFVVDTSNLIGNINDWDVTTVADGMFKHIKLDDDNQTHEIQSIKVQVVDSSSLVGATFSLSFNGQVTTPIAWDADADEVKQKLDSLSTVGDIIVSLEVDEVTNERDYTITFDPYEGKSSNSLTNFGNLPLIGISNIDDSIIIVTSDTISNGASPFRVLVSPSEATSTNTTAHDYQDEHGLSTGIYKTDTHFIIQSRDSYSNEIYDGPLREVQIVETSSSSNIGGHFELSLFGNTTRLQANTSPMQLEKALQSIPGVGSVSVSSNSAKDLVVGKTVAVTKGLDTIVPSEEVTEFIVGDWIRIGDQDTGQLFAITDMADVSPFTITLSSPYIGESDLASNVYQHGSSPLNRNGYQYIVSFDSILGDLPSLDVDGTLLEGDDATIEVTSCDWNVHQNLDAIGEGHFYLVYGSEETRLLSVDVTAQEVEDAILTDITSIHDISVSQQGSKSWGIHLKSFDGEALAFFAEGHLLSGSITVSSVCPISASDQSIYSATSVAGRRGEDYIVTLHDESTIVHGTVQHIEDGRYLATYKAPRVGTYSLSIENAHSGGLSGEYFNNRWLYNEPASTRVDSQIDFHFGDDLVTTSGKDFVSVRWTGYINLAFNEVYTFTVHVNDALKLWVGDELLIDEYENDVDEGADEYSVFSATTKEALKADQLVSTHCKEILGGHFTLSFKGQRTTEILFNASASDVKQKLEQLPSVGTVQVTRRHVNEGFEWAVTFLDHHGNEPLLSVDDHLTCS